MRKFKRYFLNLITKCSINWRLMFESLAFRNLMRGASMGLSSGQRVADMMNVAALTDKQLWHFKGDGDVNKLWPEGKFLYRSQALLGRLSAVVVLRFERSSDFA